MRAPRLLQLLGICTAALLMTGLVTPIAAIAATGDQSISAVTGWQNAKISSLKAGTTFTVVSIGGGWTVDYRNFADVGPSGYDAATDKTIYQGCKILSASPYGTLLGQIGSGPVFAIGGGGKFEANADGALRLRINDADACLGDNDGEVEVNVRAGGSSASPIKVPTSTYAGYAVYGLNALVPTSPGQQPFVSGRWTVPSVSCFPGERAESAIWVGLGGINAPLEQVATTANCDVLGRPNYSAYYEMVGQPGWTGARTISDSSGKALALNPGDVMIGSVLYRGDGSYDLNLRNDTKGWHFTKTEAGRADKSAWDTALWIVEAVNRGLIPALANFGTVSFTRSITRFGAISDPRHTKVLQLEISQPAPINIHKAFPGALSNSGDGSSFAVQWKRL
jgi:hypothetical protein